MFSNVRLDAPEELPSVVRTIIEAYIDPELLLLFDAHRGRFQVLNFNARGDKRTWPSEALVSSGDFTGLTRTVGGFHIEGRLHHTDRGWHGPGANCRLQTTITGKVAWNQLGEPSDESVVIKGPDGRALLVQEDTISVRTPDNQWTRLCSRPAKSQVVSMNGVVFCTDGRAFSWLDKTDWRACPSWHMPFHLAFVVSLSTLQVATIDLLQYDGILIQDPDPGYDPVRLLDYLELIETEPCPKRVCPCF